MKIKSLSINHFRNITNVSLSFNDRLNLFIGSNGQGKTNILETIYFILEGKSFRYSKNNTLIQFQHSETLLKANIENKNLDYFIKVILMPQQKNIFINEKKASFLSQVLPPAVLFSPESLSIIKESSDQRREFIDDIVVAIKPTAKKVQNEFKKILRARNKILKECKEFPEKIKNFKITLESLNTIYLKLSTEITILRINALKELQIEVACALNKIENKQSQITEVDFEYNISEKNAKNLTPQEVYDVMHKRLEDLSLAEMSSGLSLIGPHKHDVIFLYNGNDSRFFCSQGQQRSIILAYKMAQIVYHHKVHGFYPILLLDDVLSELDLHKQEALIGALKEIQTQTFLTTTDMDVLSRLSSDFFDNAKKVFKIHEGNIAG